jgi:hypothetical protein
VIRAFSTPTVLNIQQLSMRLLPPFFHSCIALTDIFRLRKKAENAARLKMKKMHGDKKRARKGGSRGAEF